MFVHVLWRLLIAILLMVYPIHTAGSMLPRMEGYLASTEGQKQTAISLTLFCCEANGQASQREYDAERPRADHALAAEFAPRIMVVRVVVCVALKIKKNGLLVL